MAQFKGFPPGKDAMTRLPAAFFSELLPLIDDLAELKVVLFSFWALPQCEGDYPYLTWRNFADSAALLAGLRVIAPERDALDTLRDGLRRAVARGALLCVALRNDDDQPFPLYFGNTERGRQGAELARAGSWRPGTFDQPVEILTPRPNIFKLYEDNIGGLTPLMADELKDAAAEFPADWIEDAIRQAVLANKRSWNYVRAILVRWQRDGRNNDFSRRTEKATGSYQDEPYFGYDEEGDY
ncbi:MAG: DnaD domain protein [Anaerolineaceae bacterium]|nr:MAG: DnaD domain protein [Anaerolineaceae bacterium]